MSEGVLRNCILNYLGYFAENLINIKIVRSSLKDLESDYVSVIGAPGALAAASTSTEEEAKKTPIQEQEEKEIFEALHKKLENAVRPNDSQPYLMLGTAIITNTLKKCLPEAKVLKTVGNPTAHAQPSILRNPEPQECLWPLFEVLLKQMGLHKTYQVVCRKCGAKTQSSSKALTTEELHKELKEAKARLKNLRDVENDLDVLLPDLFYYHATEMSIFMNAFTRFD